MIGVFFVKKLECFQSFIIQSDEREKIQLFGHNNVTCIQKKKG